MNKFFAFLMVSLAVVGCTITEKTVFNAKGGGDIFYELDATEFISFIEMTDTTGKPFNISDSLGDFQKATEGLQKMKGIQNVKFTPEAKKITLSFSFNDIAALNNAHRELGEKTGTLPEGYQYEKVALKNKKEWNYRIWPLGESPQDSVYSTMGMMLTYKLDVTFPKEIQAVDKKNIQTAGNKLSWTSTEEETGADFAFQGIGITTK